MNKNYYEESNDSKEDTINLQKKKEEYSRLYNSLSDEEKLLFLAEIEEV